MKYNELMMSKMGNMIGNKKDNKTCSGMERYVSHHISNSSFYQHRIINLFGEFTPDAINAIVEQLLVWEEEDAELLYNNSLKKEPTPKEQLLEPIMININSVGGNVDELFALIDILEGMETTVITRAIGKACSCAFVLFCLGDERLLGPSCSLMYHTMSGGFRGKVDEITNYAEYLKDSQKVMRELVLKKTKITKKTLDAWDRSKVDRWISVEDALKYGIATDTTY